MSASVVSFQNAFMIVFCTIFVKCIQNRSAEYQSSIPFHSYLDSMQIFLAQECLPCCKPYFSVHLGPNWPPSNLNRSVKKTKLGTIFLPNPNHPSFLSTQHCWEFEREMAAPSKALLHTWSSVLEVVPASGCNYSYATAINKCSEW